VLLLPILEKGALSSKDPTSLSNYFSNPNYLTSLSNYFSNPNYLTSLSNYYSVPNYLLQQSKQGLEI